MNLKNEKNKSQNVLPGFYEPDYEGFERCTKEEAEEESLKCWACGEFLQENEPYVVQEVYDSPWDNSPTELVLHVDNKANEYGDDCLQLLTDTSYYDFGYFECACCHRLVICRCPSNGWHEYSRISDDEEICLKCYEDDILENGISRESFEEGKISGMFLSNNLRELDWEEVDTFFINSQPRVDAYVKKAIELIDAGYIVLTEWERMAIGGLEGSVTMWKKLHKEAGDEKEMQVQTPEA